jgi:hypothetical protein
MARSGHVLGTAAGGDVCSKAMESGQGNYLANMVLYPGKAAVTAWGDLGRAPAARVAGGRGGPGAQVLEPPALLLHMARTAG